MRIKATPVVKALESCLSNVVLKARHARAEINSLILVHIRDLDGWISPQKPVTELGRGKCVKLKTSTISKFVILQKREDTHTHLLSLN